MKPTYKANVALLTAGLAVMLFSGCATHNHCSMKTPVQFGTAPDGAPVLLYTLRNQNGVEARIMT
jgi:hypothetical protein